MKKRAVVVFGQFGVAADPVNLPHFEQRLEAEGFETILIEHTDVQQAYNFLHDFVGFKAIVGSSLGAGVAPIMAGYLHQQPVDFVGGFQCSDYDPVMHPVRIQSGADLITRAVTVPNNVKEALCFRNPILAGTGGLGHATYVLNTNNNITRLVVHERADVHPGDFGIAQDVMVEKIMELSSK